MWADHSYLHIQGLQLLLAIIVQAHLVDLPSPTEVWSRCSGVSCGFLPVGVSIGILLQRTCSRFTSGVECVAVFFSLVSIGVHAAATLQLFLPRVEGCVFNMLLRLLHWSTFCKQAIKDRLS